MRNSRSPEQGKQEQLRLSMPFDKEIVVTFDGGAVCSDGGLLLLRKADDRLGLTELVSRCLHDKRRPDLVKHPIQGLFRQRLFGIATGYEDCNDATSLRRDPIHMLGNDQKPFSENYLASQPTLSRFEDMANEVSNKLLQRCLVHLYVRTLKNKKPKVLRLSMDTTCDVVYGQQQLSFYNGYYQAVCYAPLFIFTDCGFPLAALLRPGHENPALDAVRMLKDLYDELKLYFPKVRLEIKADAAFANPSLYEFCESRSITYYIAVAGHAGLAYHADSLIRECKRDFDAFGVESPAALKYAALPQQQKRALKEHEERIRASSKEEGRMQEQFESELHVRKYGEFLYQSREWSKARRIVFRVDFTKKGPDTRFVITNSVSGRPRQVYDERYCKRAQCENWIKDLKNYLKCDRTSCQEFNANQFRLLLHTFAYILIWDTRRRAGLREMTVRTFQLQLLKIGVLVTETSRKIELRLASHFVWRDQFRNAWLAT